MTDSKVKQVAIYVTTLTLSCGCLYEKHVSNENIASDPDLINEVSSYSDFWASIITVPNGQTNAVYYAGTIDGNSVLVHETIAGIRKWNLKNANINESVVMPYTGDKDQWILLKASEEEHLRYWDWHREIESFIQSQPQKSALVRPLATFYIIEGDISENGEWITVAEVFSVEATLCDALKKGDKVLSTQLYDGCMEDRKRICLNACSDGKHIVRKQQVRQDGLYYATWDKARFINLSEFPTETFYAIDNETVAPFAFMWDNTYDGLLEFDEKIAQDTYISRTKQIR